jgi:hypothetical protein
MNPPELSDPTATVSTTTTTTHPAPPTRRGAVCNPRFRPRRPDRRLDHPRAVPGEDVVECGGELAVPIANEEPELPGSLTEVHHEVTGLLGGPGPGRMSRHAHDMDGPGLDLHHEQDSVESECLFLSGFALADLDDGQEGRRW